jgi:hypothetical protein
MKSKDLGWKTKGDSIILLITDANSLKSGSPNGLETQVVQTLNSECGWHFTAPIPPPQYCGNAEMELNWRVLTSAVDHVV